MVSKSGKSKSKGDGDWKSFVKELLGSGINMGFEGARKSAFETIDHAKRSVEEVTARVIKSVFLFLLSFLGLIFLLVGLANFLDSYNGWFSGAGLLVVGGVILLLSLIINWFKN